MKQVLRFLMERALFRQFNKSNLSYTINIDAQLLNAGILDIHTISDTLDFNDYTCLKMIHHY
jgi:hypothetical protein